MMATLVLRTSWLQDRRRTVCPASPNFRALAMPPPPLTTTSGAGPEPDAHGAAVGNDISNTDVESADEIAADHAAGHAESAKSNDLNDADGVAPRAPGLSRRLAMGPPPGPCRMPHPTARPMATPRNKPMRAESPCLLMMMSRRRQALPSLKFGAVPVTTNTAMQDDNPRPDDAISGAHLDTADRMEQRLGT